MHCEACGDLFFDGSGAEVCEACQRSQQDLPPYELAHHYATVQ